jgi:hypothetical protein
MKINRRRRHRSLIFPLWRHYSLIVLTITPASDSNAPHNTCILVSKSPDNIPSECHQLVGALPSIVFVHSVQNSQSRGINIISTIQGDALVAFGNALVGFGRRLIDGWQRVCNCGLRRVIRESWVQFLHFVQNLWTQVGGVGSIEQL